MANEEADIILTADRTLMSNYHGNEFLGFGTCAPSNFIPDVLYSYMFFPPIGTNKKGSPAAAPYGLRKIEAQLLKEGFNVATVSPQHLRKYLKTAKVVGIHTMDPFGFGPASTTLASVFRKEPFLARHFQGLVSSPAIREAKRNGVKVIVGGPGAWQFKHRPQLVEKKAIDCVVEGEAENVIGKIMRDALSGKELPQSYEVPAKDAPKIEDIPDIVNASVNGLVELGRGCCRGCEFCNVTLRPLRWFPLDKIMKEITINIEGKERVICLHSEDVMLYGSPNTVPNDEKIVKLHESVMSKVNAISWSHCSLAAVASKPKLMSKVSEIILQKQAWWGAEIGLETGSASLAKKIMPAKAFPFKPEEWPQVARQGFGIMHDNKLCPAATLIVGLPEETEDDILKTMELVDDVKDCRSLIVPLFFVPLGRLKNKDWFREAQVNRLHEQLMFLCAEHSLRWVDNLLDLSFIDKGYRVALKQFYKVFAGVAKRQLRKAEIVELT